MMPHSEKQNKKPGVLFDDAYTIFSEAASKSKNVIERYYKIGAQIVLLRFANRALVPLIAPALEHLRIASSSQKNLIICIGDSESTGLMLSLPFRSACDFLARGQLRGCHTKRYQIAIDRSLGALNLLDCEKNLAIFWAQSVNRLPWWVSGSPLQMLFHWWMHRQGLQLTHAGAVGTQHGAVLLAGSGGAGKSTTALACVTAGMDYLSEDYCLVRPSPRPCIYSVYNSAKLEENTLSRFPQLRKSIANLGRQAHEKALLFQHQIYPERFAAKRVIRAILVLQIAKNCDTHLSDVSSAIALRALSASTICQLAYAGVQSFAFLANLVRSIPCYSLKLGQDFSKIPSVVTSVINQHRSGCSL